MASVTMTQKSLICIREGDKTNGTGCAVGGKGTGTEYRYSCYMAFGAVSLPAGSVVTAAVMNWRITNIAGNTATTLFAQACKQFDSSKLNGQNQPALTGTRNGTALAANKTGVLSVNVLGAVKQMLKSKTYCIKLFSPAGNNRRDFSKSIESLSITYTPPVSITTQPNAQTVKSGAKYTFAVAAKNAASYQWYKNGNAISGATAAKYTATAAKGDNGAIFYCTIKNVCGSVTSAKVKLSVTYAPSSGSLNNVTISPTGSGTFTASFTASNPAALSYAWTVGGKAKGGNSKTLAVKGSEYTPGTYSVVCTAKNSIGSASAKGTLTVTTRRPGTSSALAVAGQIAEEGESATFRVSGDMGVPAGSIAWHRSTDGGSTWELIEGETTASLQVADTDRSMAGYRYRATVTNSAGSSSAQGTLQVTYPPAITQQPLDAAAAIGETVSFTAGAASAYRSGGGVAYSKTFAWQVDGETVQEQTQTGEQNSYQMTIDSEDDFTKTVLCVVTSNGQSVETDEAHIHPVYGVARRPAYRMIAFTYDEGAAAARELAYYDGTGKEDFT